MRPRPHLTPSSLFRAEKCPASTVLPEARTVHADAESGKIEHAKLEALAPEGAHKEIAFSWDVVAHAARRLPDKREEWNLASGEIGGRADLVTVEPSLVRVRDYKTGSGFGTPPPAENLQLGIYALCATRLFDRDQAVVEVEYTGRAETRDALFDAFDLAAMASRVHVIWEAAQNAAQDVEESKEPPIVEGDHCWRCPCYARCPAKTRLALAVGAGEIDRQLPTLELTPVAVARGWERLKLAKKLIGEVERIYRGYAAEAPVPLGGGLYLGEVVREVDALDGPTTFKVLRELHGDEVAREAVAMETSKTALGRALAPIAPPRGKAQMVRTALAAIEKAGGVRKDEQRRIEEYAERLPKHGLPPANEGLGPLPDGTMP